MRRVLGRVDGPTGEHTITSGEGAYFGAWGYVLLGALLFVLAHDSWKAHHAQAFVAFWVLLAIPTAWRLIFRGHGGVHKR